MYLERLTETMEQSGLQDHTKLYTRCTTFKIIMSSSDAVDGNIVGESRDTIEKNTKAP
jgi:hypothetical protein